MTAATATSRRPAASHLFRSERVAVADLLDLEAARSIDAENATEPVFYWEHPSEDEAWLAHGAVAHFIGRGHHAVERARRKAVAALQRALPAPGETAAPRVVGGFAFAPEIEPEAGWSGYPPAWFFLPRRLWIRQGSRCELIECEDSAGVAPAPRAAPGRLVDEADSAWCERVEAALADIGRGTFDKVVLSRSRSFPGLRPTLRSVLATLRSTRPQCYTFALRTHGSVFFGSTPELLVERQIGRFVCPALAGTSRRSGDPQRDAELAEALLACPKNRREHAAVVAGIRAALAPLPLRLDADQDPHVIELPEAIHLRTPIAGRGAEALDVLQLASVLHPTPAVCGAPRDAAATLLRRTEAQRGWYTGGIGWMDAAGDGEIAVGLRSALIADGSLSVFAGAGIVAGSEPRAELEETRIKMEAMLAPLRATAETGASDTPAPQAWSA